MLEDLGYAATFYVPAHNSERAVVLGTRILGQLRSSSKLVRIPSIMCHLPRLDPTMRMSRSQVARPGWKTSHPFPLHHFVTLVVSLHWSLQR